MGLRITGTGWWEYDRKADAGTFRCPKEGDSRAYEIRRVNRWITILYIPVIPLGTRGTYVKCTSCRGKFPLSTLQEQRAGGSAPAAVEPAS